jgi:hypothetical protein
VSGGEDGVCYQWNLRPPGELPDKEPATLWNDLASENNEAAYSSMWKLSTMPDQTVALLAEKLHAIKTVIDLDHAAEGISAEEAGRRRRLVQTAIAKHSGVEATVTVRRAISLLAELGTPSARELLNELADQKTNADIRQVAAAAIQRLEASQ